MPVSVMKPLTRPPVGAGGPATSNDCAVWWLGRVEYEAAWDLQRRLSGSRAAGEIADTLLLLEHPPTYTLGRTGKESNLLLSRDDLAGLGAAVFHVDRGGDVTYHGPGQLVGYPIMLIEDRHDLLGYIRQLEEVIIRTLADFGIKSGRIVGLSGVWIGSEKVAAIGVKMGRVTSHGFALNVSTDMTYFEHIIPCGIGDKGVTSVAKQLGSSSGRPGTGARANPPAVEEVASNLTRHFGQIFNRRMVSSPGGIESGAADVH